jgi:F-type H+-transporting ATPase subunit epsilon
MLKVSVISPEASLFQGDATSVVAPAFDGEVGILTGHAPMMTLLGKGELSVRSNAAEARRFAIEGGFLQVVDDSVRIVTEKGAAL